MQTLDITTVVYQLEPAGPDADRSAGYNQHSTKLLSNTYYILSTGIKPAGINEIVEE